MTPTFKELADGLIELKKQAYPSETVRITASHINRILEALERADKNQQRTEKLEMALRPFSGMTWISDYYVEECCPDLVWPVRNGKKINTEGGPSSDSVGVADFERARAALKGGDAE